MAVVITVLVVLVGAGLFLHIITPMIIRLEERTNELTAANEQLRHVIEECKRAEEALSREAEVNASMAELSKALLTSASIADVSHLVLKHAKRLTGSKFGFVGYIEEKTGYLVCPTLTRDIWDICQVKEKDIVFKKFGGLWGWVLDNRKSLLTNAPKEDPRASGTPAGHIPIQRFLSAPAVMGEKLIGQVALANPDRDYTGQDFAVVERLADIYALAIQRKRDEDEFRKLFRAVEHSSSSVVITDTKGDIEYVNPRFTQVTGYTAQEAIGQNPRILKSDTQPPEFYKELWDTILSGQEWRGEFCNRKKDGELYWGLASISPIRDTQGGIIGFVAVTEDVTEERRIKEELNRLNLQLEARVEQRTAELQKEVIERKQAEEQLRKSKIMLQAVFDGISDPLILLDRKLSLKMFNKAALEYYQVEIPDIFGKPCHQALKGRSEPCEECVIPSAVLEKRPAMFERKGFKDPDRLEKIVMYPVKERDSGERSAIIRISDITEARLMEKQLLQSEKLASLGFLVSGIAHEINNPNNFITFNIPIMRDYLQELMPIIDDYAGEQPDLELFGMSYPEFRKDIFKLLDNIEHGSHRITGTVSNLREFSRKKDTIAPAWVDIEQVIEKAITITRGKIRRMVKSLEANIPEGLPPVYTDPEALEHVLINLLINAAQAGDKEDSWVRLRVTPGSSWREHLIIEVGDNGCGMDEACMARIFDPFFTTKSPGEGTGLGLSICHSLIEGLGGRIEVESAPARGSTIKVTLPNKDRRRMKRL